MFAGRIIAVAALALFGGSAADAQDYRYDYRSRPAYGGAVPPFEIVTIVRSLGLDPIDRPIWRDGRYVVAALDDDGRRMRVIVDATSGRVLAVRPIAVRYETPDVAYEPRIYGSRPAPYPYEPRYAPMPDDEFYDDVPPTARPQRQGSLTPPTSALKPATAPSSKPTKTVTSNPTALPPLDKKATDAKAADTKGSAGTVARHESGSAEPPKTIRKIEIDKKPAEPAPETKPAEQKPVENKPIENTLE